MPDNPFKIATGKGRRISVDSFDIEIQDGRVFKVNNKVASLGAGNTHTLHIETSTDYAYIQNLVVSLSDGPVDVVIKEAPTITTGSTNPTVRNLNRESTKTPSTNFYTDSTSITGGTTLERDFVPTGKDTAFILSDDTKWILKPNTDYVIQIVNNSGQILTLSYKMIYQEHD